MKDPIDVFLFTVKERSDRLANYFLVGYFLFGLFLAQFYGTWQIACGVGGLSLVAYYSTRLALPGSSFYQFVLSAVLGIFLAQFIYQMHGMFEMHFFAFIGSATLITYQKWKLQVPIFIVVLVHHSVFAYLQDNGHPEIYFSQLAYFDFPTFFIHILLTVIIFFICGLWAYQLHRQNRLQIMQTGQMIELRKDAQFSMERRQSDEDLEAANQLLRGTNLELQEARRAAENASKAKDLFLANMSHEIRTPINAIMGISKLMEKTVLAPQQAHYLKIIGSATSSLKFIIDDILDFSKIAAGKLSLERIGFYLDDVVSSAMDMVAFGAREKGLELAMHPCHDKKVLLGDPFRLKQVLLNLLTNAVKFTAKGSVDVDCHDNGTSQGKCHITIQVKDTGRGMEGAFLKILFEKFTQEDDSIARSYSGTGLGMSISKQLVGLMGGTLTAESRKNLGTTFSLDLYLEEGNKADLLLPDESQINIALLKNKHILLVEDNEMNQLVAKTILEQNGMGVTIAANGEQAVARVGEKEFHLVLMDMQMPVMDGLEATRIIRRTNKEVPIVSLTANAIQGERERCLAVGMNDFLAKPFEEYQLLSILCKWLDKKAGFYGTGLLKPTLVPNSLVTAGELDGQPKLFNLDQIRSLGHGNDGFVRSIVGMFIKDANETALRMGEAFRRGDLVSVQQLAHRIKPSIDQLAIPYIEQVRRIEELCMLKETTTELESLIRGFQELMAKVVPLMESGIS